MNASKTVYLVFFSGTGGTARVAEHFEKSFAARQIEVHKTELTQKKYSEYDCDLLVILYPVYALNAPRPIDEWIAQAPAGNGKPTAVISVSGGGEVFPNKACRVDVIKQLEAKGYDVCYERMLVMPANALVAYDDVLSAMLLRSVPHKTEQAVSEILSGKRVRTKPPLIDLLCAKLLTVEKSNSHTFAKKLEISDNCVGCAWCAEHCPRGNITMQDGKPVFGNECVICLRCVYGCPKKAIAPRAGKFIVRKDGFDLDALEQRTQHVTEFPPASQAAKGLLMVGVKKYLEED